MFLVILWLVRLSLCFSVSLPQSVSLFLSLNSHFVTLTPVCTHRNTNPRFMDPTQGPSEPWLALKLENDGTGATTQYKRWILQM